MSRRHTPALLGLAIAIALPISAARAATATIYYDTAYKGWSTANIHHNASGSWTAVPGVAMDEACGTWKRKTLTSSASSFQAVFNNGTSSAWDNPTGGGNYTITDGVHRVRNGAITANAGNPCDTSGGNTATVFYKPDASWTTVNIHYGINGTWTTPPGVAMEAACTGWRKKTISLGTATGLAVTFNNGSTWDNNGGANYALGTGNIKVESRAVSAGDPCGDLVAPSMPTNVRQTAATTTTITLAWDQSTDNVGVTGYEVYLGGVLVTSLAGNSLLMTGLAPATTYQFTVLAKDAAGNKSAQSAAVPGTTLGDTAAPTAPSNLTASASGTTVSLSWGASTDDVGVTGYEVSRSGGSQGAKTLVATNTSYSDSGLDANTTYSYSVKAYDASGKRSTASNTVQATTGTGPAAGTPLGTDMRAVITK